MKQINEGVLWEIAFDVLRTNGYILNRMTWDANYQSMNIKYDHTGMLMNLDVYGLPEDIPHDVFKGLIEHFIKTELRGMKKVSLDKNVAAWLNVARAKRRASA